MNFIKRSFLLAFFLSLKTYFVVGQTFIPSYQTVVNQVSQSTITTNLTEFESLGVKRRGTASLQNTLNWLKNKYLSYGYTTSQMQEDSFINGAFTCKNLIVTKIGTVYPNIYVIVCGHYDSIIGTGTNDNGSGVVSILETARLLQNIPTEYSIKFINFSGEEDGLVGSQHYVSSVVNSTTPKMNIKVVFNLDEVGGVAGALNNTITCEQDTGSPTSNNAASNVMTNQLINCVDLYTSLNTNLSYAYASDYMPFEDNNEVITGFFETNETTHRHTATDLLVNMDPVYNYNVAKAAVGATMHFATANTSSLQIEDFNADYQINFYPNPSHTILNISKGAIPSESYGFTIIDSNGRIVFEKDFKNAKSIEQLNVSFLSKGLYLGVLNFNNNRVTKKFLID
jgi:aminopeptidase YwaD